MKENPDGDIKRDSPVYEVTAYVEQGWWLVHAVDIGQSAQASTLNEIDLTARRMYASYHSRHPDEISIRVTVYRVRRDVMMRAAWRRTARA